MEKDEIILFNFQSCLNLKIKRNLYIHSFTFIIGFIIFFSIVILPLVSSSNFELIIHPLILFLFIFLLLGMLFGCYILIFIAKQNRADYYITNKRIIKWFYKNSRFLKLTSASFRVSELAHVAFYADFMKFVKKGAREENHFNGNEKKLAYVPLRFKSIKARIDCDKGNEIKKKIIEVITQNLNFRIHPNLEAVFLSTE
ncbi:MAG: hypothetical protein KGD65_16960 [Candidatus Lokiarchaeota archaeon]|nr:hypothetical protein [Candidatus Lokiarchaeota archaeon]